MSLFLIMMVICQTGRYCILDVQFLCVKRSVCGSPYVNLLGIPSSEVIQKLCRD